VWVRNPLDKAQGVAIARLSRLSARRECLPMKLHIFARRAGEARRRARIGSSAITCRKVFAMIYFADGPRLSRNALQEPGIMRGRT
jgi:hypothetical protein